MELGLGEETHEVLAIGANLLTNTVAHKLLHILDDLRLPKVAVKKGIDAVFRVFGKCIVTVVYAPEGGPRSCMDT